MNIYLINPPGPDNTAVTREGRCHQKKGVWTTTWPPLSLITIASVLRESGFLVHVDDYNISSFSLIKLRSFLEEYKPDLIVLNTVTPSIDSDLALVQYIKSVSPKAKITVFGIHVSMFTKECLELQPNLDFIVRGEPEYTFKELALALKRNEGISSIKGISYKVNDKVINNQDREPIGDLNKLPFPAWDCIPVDKYRLPITRRPFVSISTSRGCPYSCVFCAAQSYYGKKLRLRSAVKVVDEMEWVIKKFNVKDFFFWSEMFTLNKQHVIDICREILRRELKVSWTCNSRVDTVGLEMLETIKKAGCWMISFGIESASQKVLDMAKKKITIQQSEEAVRIAKKAGLQIAGHFILGLPGDSKITMRNTIDFAKRLDLDYAQFYCAEPAPGSELYSMALEKEWITSKDWRNYNQEKSILDVVTTNPKEVTMMQQKAVRELYFRPKFIFRTLTRVRSLKELWNLLSAGFEFLKQYKYRIMVMVNE